MHVWTIFMEDLQYKANMQTFWETVPKSVVELYITLLEPTRSHTARGKSSLAYKHSANMARLKSTVRMQLSNGSPWVVFLSRQLCDGWACGWSGLLSASRTPLFEWLGVRCRSSAAGSRGPALWMHWSQTSPPGSPAAVFLFGFNYLRHLCSGSLAQSSPPRRRAETVTVLTDTTWIWGTVSAEDEIRSSSGRA